LISPSGSSKVVNTTDAGEHKRIVAKAYLALGNLQVHLAENDDALKSYDIAGRLGAEMVDNELLDRLLHARARFYHMTADYDKAIEAFELCKSHAGKDLRTNLMLDQGLAQVYIARADHERAEAMMQKCLVAAERLLDKSWLAKLHNILAGQYIMRQKYQESRESLQKSMSLCRELGDKARYIDCIRKLAAIELETGNCQRAFDLFTELIQQAGEVGDRRTVAVATGNLGGALIGMGRNEEAKGHLEFALSECIEIGYLFGAVYWLYMLTSIYKEGPLLDLVRAREYANQHLQLAEQLKQPHQVRLAIRTLGYIEYTEGSLQESARLYLSQLDGCESDHELGGSNYALWCVTHEEEYRRRGIEHFERIPEANRHFIDAQQLEHMRNYTPSSGEQATSLVGT
jgi:tetratricopeptide (TPR) repeat protein